MNTQFISIPFQPSLAETMTMLKIDPEMEDEFCDVYEECIAVARPKAVFCLTPVRQEQNETVIGEERFRSRIMQSLSMWGRPYEVPFWATTFGCAPIRIRPARPPSFSTQALVAIVVESAT